MHLLRIILGLAALWIVGVVLYNVICYLAWVFVCILIGAAVGLGISCIYLVAPKSWKNKFHDITGTEAPYIHG